MRWNPWLRVGLGLLGPMLVGVMFAGGECAQEPTSSPPPGPARTAQTVRPQASPETAHVREIQRALLNAGYDPGPVDGIFGPRTKSALRRYIAVPPPLMPAGADPAIRRLRTDERRETP